MYTLKEAWHRLYDSPPYEDWDGQFICIEMDAHKALLTNKTQGMMSCYTYNLITQGWITISYNGKEITIRRNDLYTYAPGQSINVLDVSDDLRGYTLMAEESITLDAPLYRSIIRAAYLPIAALQEPVVHLAPLEAHHLQQLMLQIIDYFGSQHRYKQESLRLLYSLFLLDVLHAQEQVVVSNEVSKRTEDIFLDFMHLLPQHFEQHHDISFYAAQLHITPTYLSRIVRKTTGRTVIDQINQMLVMEASFLLVNSKLSISQIADRLHFADLPSFSRFFTRMKGISPKEYRERR